MTFNDTRVSNEELKRWAEQRADDAGRLARELVARAALSIEEMTKTVDSVRNEAILDAISLLAERRNAYPPGRDFQILNESMGDLNTYRRKNKIVPPHPLPAAPTGDTALVEALCMPTEAMLIAARDWSDRKYGKPIGNDAAIGCWQAMFDAAPSQPATPQPSPDAGVLAWAELVIDAVTGWLNSSLIDDELQDRIVAILEVIVADGEALREYYDAREEVSQAGILNSTAEMDDRLARARSAVIVARAAMAKASNHEAAS